MADDYRQLVLDKDGQRYIFRYQSGEESKVLASLMEMARDPSSEMDWFDAAILSYQMGRRMNKDKLDILEERKGRDDK
tara:strand:+ start:836 stop:1069 length:234 start_codon:yes stop_codon:yes gene_type:complete